MRREEAGEEREWYSLGDGLDIRDVSGGKEVRDSGHEGLHKEAEIGATVFGQGVKDPHSHKNMAKKEEEEDEGEVEWLAGFWRECSQGKREKKRRRRGEVVEWDAENRVNKEEEGEVKEEVRERKGFKGCE